MICRSGVVSQLLDPATRQSVLDEIIILVNAGEITEVRVCAHDDCAWERSKGTKFASPDEEDAQHRDDALKAAAIIEEALGEVRKQRATKQPSLPLVVAAVHQHLVSGHVFTQAFL